MLTQYDRRIVQAELGNTTFITWILTWSIYCMNNSYLDTKNLKHKTYRIKKLKFPEIYTKNHSQTHTQT